MRRALIWAALVLSVATIPAMAAGIMPYFLAGGGGSPPPTCSNSLDFSAACNSQYISVVLQ